MCLPGGQVPFCRPVAKSLKESIALSLRGRARRIVAQICSVGQEEAAAALESTQGDLKAAVVCILTRVPPDVAKERLAQAGGILRAALTESSLPV